MTTFQITSAPDGSWPSATDAFYSGGKSYVGFGDNAGLLRVLEYDHGVGTSTTVGGPTTVDQHNRPALLRRSSDGRLVSIFGGHGLGTLFRRISTNPDDSTSWAAADDIDPDLGSTAYGYPHLFQLAGEVNDPIYLFYRDFDGLMNWEIAKSTDGGSTWGSFTNLFFATRSYGICFQTSDTRLDFACTDGSYAEDFASMYHFYYEGGSYFQTDGTPIVDTPPIAFSNMTKIYDGASAGARFPNSIAVVGSEIVVTFPVQTGTPTNHIGTDGDYIYCRYAGGTWSAHTVAASVGMTSFEFTEGGIAVDPADLDRVVLSKRGAGGTGTWRIFDYRTTDGGDTWSSTQVTTSGDEDRYPVFITNHADELEYVWLKGTFTDQDTYNDAIYGASATVSSVATGPGVWIDWDQDGFDDGTGSSVDPDYPLARMLPEAGSSGTVNDNITTDVVSFEWTRGASSDHVGQPSPGTCTIIVKNGATAAEPGKYTPENSSGTLYGKLRPGLPVWIGRNEDGTLSGSGQTVYGVWAGYVRQIVPIPVAGASDTPTAQIICEDPLGWYARQPVQVADALSRSYAELRAAILDAIGESSARRDLADEIDTIPISAADSDSALRVLEEINSATGSRHFIEPADSKEDWYFYTVRDRHDKLTSATDFTLNADNIQSTDGYRVTEENVNNLQRVEVSPARLPAGISTVWTYKDSSFAVSGHKGITATFEDFVTDAALDYTVPSGSITLATLVNYGRTAAINFWGGFGAVVANLTVEGRQVIRDSTEAVIAEDTSSQIIYGRRAGAVVSGDYVQSTDLAQGLADFLVWKFGTARARMDVSITNLLSTLNGRTMYDTVGLTFDRLYLTGKRFEIIGEEGACDLAASASAINWRIDYELQETPNQSALDLFVLDSSSLDGTDILGY